MNKYLISFLICTLCFSALAEAQVGVYIGPRYGPGYGRGYRHRQQRPQEDLPPFQPTVNLSFGYGFPNLDKDQLPDFFNLYKGTTTSQTGPVTGAIDYRFSRNMSIGVLVTHGEVKVPYYNYNEPSSPVFTGSLDNWSVMLNFMRYIQATEKITPYIRTAVGINTWQQNYTDAQGNKVNMDGSPSELAYQVGLGADFYLSKNAGLFLEAGYGKYILHGGLTFRF
jgi:opacity protein-like surface antigen